MLKRPVQVLMLCRFYVSGKSRCVGSCRLKCFIKENAWLKGTNSLHSARVEI